MSMDDAQERFYLEGERAAWLRMLRHCLRELEVDDPVAGAARWVSERGEVVAILRTVCAEHGDNDWPDNLNLADVIEKHLWRGMDKKSREMVR